MDSATDFEAGAVDHRLDLGVLEGRIEGRSVAHVAFHETDFATSNSADGRDRGAGGIREVIQNDYTVARGQQL